MAQRVWLAVLCAAVFGLVTGAPAAPEPVPAPPPVVGRSWDDPPPEIVALFKQVHEGTPAACTAALQTLGKSPEAEPYLRLAVAHAGADTQPCLKAALAELRAAVDARNVARAKDWLAAGRVDVLVEAVCAARSDEAADAMTAHLTLFAEAASDRATTLLGMKGGKFPYVGPMSFIDGASRSTDPHKRLAEFIKHQAVKHTGEHVRLDKTKPGRPVFARAQRVSSAMGLFASVVVVRDQWTGSQQPVNKFWDSLLFTNGDVELDDTDRCLVVTDGDLTRWGPTPGGAEAWWSIVIARGAVRGPGRMGAGAGNTCVWTGGDMALRSGEGDLRGSALVSGGTIDLDPKRAKEATVVKEKDTSNPFGVRFFELKELGVEAEGHAKGARIKSLAADSPLAAQGLRVGDVVYQINDTQTDSVKEFRRELRRSLMWEAGVFWFTRDGQRLTRVVRFPDGFK